MLELVRPDTRYKESYFEALNEFRSVGRHLVQQSHETKEEFEAYVKDVLSWADENNTENRKGRYVPETIFWLVDDEGFAGKVSIRHRLTDSPESSHIGYEIRPSKQGKGYGTEILRLALEKARDLGIDDVRIICRKKNEASKRVIEKNGGVLEDEIPMADGADVYLRYWVRKAAA